MFGKLGDMMGKLQEMKQKAEEVKNRLEATELYSESAGGDIKVTITGSRKVKRIEVAPGLQHGDKVKFEEQLAAAVNKAIEAADKMNEEEMKKAAGGLLPGVF
jgi:nucleoid-associated protein EbfC